MRPSRASDRGSSSGSPAIAGSAVLELAGDLLAQLDDHPLGGALADPRHGLEALRVAGGDRPQQLARGAAGEDRDRDLGADAGDRGQVQEEVALLLAGEAVERQRVVAGDEVGVQGRLLAAGGHRLQGLGGDREPVADAGRLDHDVIGTANQNLAADRGDHPTPDLAAARRRERVRGPARGPRGRSRPRARRRRGRTRGGRGRPSRAPTIRWTWRLVRRAGAADRHLHGLRRVVEAGDPGLGGGQHARPRAPGRPRSPSARSCRSRRSSSATADRLVPVDQLVERGVDAGQPALERLVRRRPRSRRRRWRSSARRPRARRRSPCSRRPGRCP